jgi:hypothetical protein
MCLIYIDFQAKSIFIEYKQIACILWSLGQTYSFAKIFPFF